MTDTGNIYTISFPFNGDWHYTNISATQLANESIKSLLGDTLYDDDIFDKDQVFEYRFCKDNKKYICTFSHNSVKLLNVYELTDDEEDEWLVEKDIPYQILKISNNKNDIYKLSDFI